MPPGIDGIEALGRMFKIDPDLQGVLVTAHLNASWPGILQQLPDVDRYLLLETRSIRVEARQMVAALSAKRQLAIKSRRMSEELKMLAEESAQQGAPLYGDFAERRRRRNRVRPRRAHPL